MKRNLILLSFLITYISSYAQNWDYIKSSSDYYFAESTAETEELADKEALSILCSMIAVHVSSDFVSNYEQTISSQQLDHKEFVHRCILTYTSSTLTNCERMTIGSEPNITVRRWMKRSELSKIYELRIAKAKDMVDMAKEAYERNKLGIALQYYYWAYALICSLQYPNDVKDDEGHVLANWILPQMRYLLSDIQVSIDQDDGENVDLLFSYNHLPVSELEFNYIDGREICTGKAKDGRGTMQMIPNFDGSVYHIDIEYEYKSLARGDAEMESVLNIIGKAVLPEATKDIKVNVTTQKKLKKNNTLSSQIKPIKVQVYDASNEDNVSTQADIMKKIILAIRTKRNTNAYKYFTLEGREMFDKIISYGKGRIVGSPDITFYKNNEGETIARGLQMSFSFRNGTKTTFVEDVVFTFNQKGKIDNISFGLGKDAENDILLKKIAWKDDTKEQLLEFLENYKTAYCLKRIDYIRDIFADDAIIIVGNVTRMYSRGRQVDSGMSIKGKNIITTNRYTKDKYLKNLARCFMRNEFINVRFTHSDIQKLEKSNNNNIVCVQLAQDYNSSSYADKGFLFLMIDMSDVDSPFIKVRTWQPEPDPKFGYYNAGDFYDD